MRKQDLAMVFSGTTFVVGVYYGLKTGRNWLYYLALFFVISSAAGMIGYGLGKEETA